MRRRAQWRRVIAVAVLLGSWGPALASVVIAWVFELPELPMAGAFLSASPPVVQSRFDDIGVVVALIYGPLSALLIVRRPHPVASILAVHAVGSGIAALGVQWGLLGQIVPGLPLWGLLAHAAGWGYIPGTVMTTIIPLLLIGPLTAFRRGLVVVATACASAGFFAALTQQAEGGPPNPFAIPIAAYQQSTESIYAVAVVVAVAVSCATAVIILQRWLGLPPDDRRGLGWLVTGHIFLTVSYGSLILPDMQDVPGWVWDFGMIAPVVGQVFYPAAVLVMVLGQRLSGIDVAIGRVLLWAILVVVSVAGYLVLVSALGSVLDWTPLWIGIAAALVVALGIQPVRSWLQGRIDRLVYPTGMEPREIARSLGERVGELESGGEGLRTLASAFRSASRLGSVAFVDEETRRVLVRVGYATGPVTEVPLRAGDRVIGRISVTARRGERVRRRAVRSLEEISGVVAAAVQLAIAGDELERAREEVLAVRQEERRLIRRELHDGIGPALAGIGFGLAGVANMLENSPEAARDLLARLTDDLRERLISVRGLVRAMDTDDGDLSERLEELAEDFSGAGPFITVHAPGGVLLSASQRQAAYFIAAEALHNAVRHAGSERIDIELDRREDGFVRLTVTDDGRGFDAAGAGGVGMASMRETAAGVSAELRVDSSRDHGTTISVDFERTVP